MPRAVGGRARPSVFFDSSTYAKREGGGRHVSVGGDPPDCVKVRRATAVSALALTVATFSLLFRDVLRLLGSGLVRTLLLEGECGDMAGDVRPDSGMGVLLSIKERREVLGRLGGGGAALLIRSGGGDGQTATGRSNPHPATWEAGPGTQGGVQGNRAAETTMVTLAATVLEGRGNPSDTPEQQHGSPTLPLGGGRTSSDTVGHHHGGHPTSDCAIIGGTWEEGGLDPWRRG